MSIAEFAPPTTPPGRIVEALRSEGFAVLSAEWARALTGASAAELSAFAREWEGMPADPYLKDGGHYRRRRHASFVIDGGSCESVPHRAHFQPLDYNALHGGMLRWFEPIRPTLSGSPRWSRLLCGLADVCGQVRSASRWWVEAHQFRIDTSEGIGRPTPEGAHRDGVDFVALLLIARHQVRGGETRVFDAHAPRGLRFTLSEPWSLLLLDDERVIHESTPIQPLLGASSGESGGHRDTLVLTFRRQGFQAP